MTVLLLLITYFSGNIARDHRTCHQFINVPPTCMHAHSLHYSIHLTCTTEKRTHVLTIITFWRTQVVENKVYYFICATYNVFSICHLIYDICMQTMLQKKTSNTTQHKYNHNLFLLFTSLNKSFKTTLSTTSSNNSITRFSSSPNAST
jgi:hypothetical protein